MLKLLLITSKCSAVAILKFFNVFFLNPDCVFSSTIMIYLQNKFYNLSFNLSSGNTNELKATYVSLVNDLFFI